MRLEILFIYLMNVIFFFLISTGLVIIKCLFFCLQEGKNKSESLQSYNLVFRKREIECTSYN